MDVIYSGPHPEVVVDAFDTNQVIKRGTPVTVPNDLGASLIEQDTWAEVTQTASTPTVASTPVQTPVSTPDAVSAAPVASDDATNGNS